MKRFLIITLFVLFAAISLSAQSVRPVPHEMVPAGKKTLNLSKGVVVADPKGVFSDAVGFLPL